MVATFLPPFIAPDALLPQLRERGYAVMAPQDVAALCGVEPGALQTLKPVSYTHLDVYKRQACGC